jgi:aquaporin related protein
MNPVRSLAPCIVNDSWPSYLWIYFVGPIAGVILAVLIYKLVKALEYETAQDEDPTPNGILPITKDVERKPSSVIAMTSVHEDSLPKTPDLQDQAPNKTATRSISHAPPPEKEGKAALPECLAD